MTESTDFNTVNQLELDNTGDDGFVFKLDNTGNALLYSTYLGGNNADDAADVAVDDDGRAFIAGDSASSDFPLTVGAHDSTTVARDYFLTVLSVSGTMPGIRDVRGRHGPGVRQAVDIDEIGNAYILGTSNDPLNSPEANALQGDTEGTLNDLYVDSDCPRRHGRGLRFDLRHPRRRRRL